jgi:diguanylate cyclase (GGDEF)-like protein
LTQVNLEREVGERQTAEHALRGAHEQLESLLAEAHTRESELQKLGELVRLVQSCLSEEEACGVIADGVHHLLPMSSGRVYSVSMLESAHAVASWGVGPPETSSFLLDHCWAARSTNIHANVRTNSVVRCLHLVPESNRASICVPLRAQNELVGLVVLLCEQERAADGEPVPSALRRAKILMEAVAAHVTPALTNLRLRQSLRDQAVRDSLTGLFNRRYMEETLDREVRRAIRRNRPLSVLMLDLDCFKRYNDRYGHAAGDTVLRRVGTFLHRRIRTEDIACRYGGEEFVVILPEATPEVALQRAEEIRAGIKQLKIIHDARALDYISASIGLASASPELSEGSSLLRAADVALYQSKEAGRDRVTVANAVSASVRGAASHST